MFAVAKASEVSRLAFYKQIKAEMREYLDQIIVYSDLLRKALRKDLDFALPQNKQLELLENIYSAAINLDASKAIISKPSYINVNEAIHEGITIQLYSAFIKGVTIKADLSPNLPIFECREIAFKQFAVGLISLGLEYNAKGGILKISTSLELEDNQAFLVIALQDNGFSLDEKDIKRISGKFYNEGLKALSNDISLDFTEIESFIKAHKGNLRLEPKKNAGKKIIITLPYQNKNEDKDVYEFNRDSVNRICKFTKIKKDISKNA